MSRKNFMKFDEALHNEGHKMKVHLRHIRIEMKSGSIILYQGWPVGLIRGECSGQSKKIISSCLFWSFTLVYTQVTTRVLAFNAEHNLTASSYMYGQSSRMLGGVQTNKRFASADLKRKQRIETESGQALCVARLTRKAASALQRQMDAPVLRRHGRTRDGFL